jgi:phospholipid/cholesterol/gamma-HCH transport system substrate-binding protein
MDTKVNYTVVGLFVLLLSVALIALVLWFGAGNYTRTVYDTFYAYMRESVSGLNVNAPVKYRGVEIGKVREIILDPDNPELVRLRLEIVRGSPIKSDTVAVLSVQGLTGIAFVDLTGGSRTSPLLKAKPGKEYPEITTGPSLFARVDMALNQALNNVNQLTEDVHALLEPKNRESVRNILAHIDALTATLASRDQALQAGVDHAVKTLENTAKASADLPELVAGIKGTAQALERMANQLTSAGSGLTQTVEHSRHDVDAFAQQTLPEAAQLVSNLRDLSNDLQRLTRELDRDPSAVLYGRRTTPPGPGE